VTAVAFDSSTNSVSVHAGGRAASRCFLSKKLAHVAPRFNWNKSIIILTDIDFVTLDDVQTCSGGSAQPSEIPKKVGFLVDVNPRYGIYLALDVVAVSPMAFSATVARLGTTHSLLNAPGIFSWKKSEERVKEEAFGYVESTSGRISSNGRYVSADGTMDCTSNAYPGVWDLLLRKNVISEDGCDDLFDSADGPGGTRN
jgi:hypothetical protein